MSVHETIRLPAGAEVPAAASGSLFFVGNATTVLRLGGFTILTDPNFLHAGDHAHLGYGLSARRLTDPAIEIDALPDPDFCVLSHMHGDHWDHVAAERLRKDLPIVTTGQAARVLRGQGFQRPIPMETWEAVDFEKGDARLRLTSLPGRHGPPLVSKLLPTVMGSLLEFGRGGTPFRVYISGDTLVYDDLREIPQRFPGIDLGLFHLGGTRVLGILVTMDVAQGVEAIRIIRPATAVPIHYDDYEVFKSQLGDPGSDQERPRGAEVVPFDDFARRVETAAPGTRVQILRRGDTFTFDLPAQP